MELENAYRLASARLIIEWNRTASKRRDAWNQTPQTGTKGGNARLFIVNLLRLHSWATKSSTSTAQEPKGAWHVRVLVFW